MHIVRTSENPREECADLQSVEASGGKAKGKANIASIFFRSGKMKSSMPTLEAKEEEREESHQRKEKEGKEILQVVMVKS